MGRAIQNDIPIRVYLFRLNFRITQKRNEQRRKKFISQSTVNWKLILTIPSDCQIKYNLNKNKLKYNSISIFPIAWINLWLLTLLIMYETCVLLYSIWYKNIHFDMKIFWYTNVIWLFSRSCCLWRRHMFPIIITFNIESKKEALSTEDVLQFDITWQNCRKNLLSSPEYRLTITE